MVRANDEGGSSRLFVVTVLSDVLVCESELGQQLLSMDCKSDLERSLK